MTGENSQEDVIETIANFIETHPALFEQSIVRNNVAGEVQTIRTPETWVTDVGVIAVAHLLLS